MTDAELQQIRKSLQTIDQQMTLIRRILGEKSAVPEGVVGVFDGEFMIEESGKKHQIPPNYASKSMLVVGDTVKMIPGASGGQAKFKQIEKVERVKIEGVLAKKDGKYEVLTEVGSYKVLPVAIKHYNGEVGDQVKIQIPKNHARGGWAAVEKVIPTAKETQGIAPLLLNPIVADVPTSPPPASESSAEPTNIKLPAEKQSENSATPSDVSSNKPASTSATQKAKSNKKKPKRSSSESSSADKGKVSSSPVEPARPAPAAAPSEKFVEVSFDDDDII